MDFFYRVFTAEDKHIWGDEIESFLKSAKKTVNWSVYGVVDEEDEADLDAVPIQIVFTDDQDREVAVLEYDVRSESETLNEEIDELQDVVDDMLPECNRAWAHEKLSNVIGCYSFNVSDIALNESDIWDGLAEIAAWLREELNGVEQTDDGQITNEKGLLILTVPDDFDSDDEEMDDFESDSDFEEIAAEEECDEDENAEEEDEEEDDFEDEDAFMAAIFVDGHWVEKAVDSDEAFDAFLRGEV